MAKVYDPGWLRSIRITQLLEELGEHYKLVWPRRNPKTRRAPEELREIRALGKALVIEDLVLWTLIWHSHCKQLRQPLGLTTIPTFSPIQGVSRSELHITKLQESRNGQTEKGLTGSKNLIQNCPIWCQTPQKQRHKNLNMLAMGLEDQVFFL